MHLYGEVGVAYASDVERAMALVVEAAAEQPRVLKEPPPMAFLVAFADSSITLELGFWIDDPKNGTLGLRSDINRAILRRFREAGIEIPFPQRTLTTAGGKPLPIELVVPGKAEHGEGQPAPPGWDANARVDRPGGAGAAG